MWSWSWILTASLVVVALSIQEGETKSCTHKNRNYNNGDQWLDNRCNVKYKCKKGEVQEDDYECPSDSACKNGQCQCSNGFATERESKGLLKKCKRTDFNCKQGNKNYNNGAYWLKSDCSVKYRCKGGEIEEKDKKYKCPDNSECKNGQCRCENGFESQTDSANLVKNCKRTSNDCRQGNKNFNNGNYWLSDNCRVKYKCKNGEIEESEKNYRCPDNSQCKNGQCQCDDGWTTEKQSNNMLKKCKSVGCKHANKFYDNGDVWIQQDCKQAFKCNNGEIKQGNYDCPSNSECFKGQCRCKNGYDGEVKRSTGLLKSCKRNSDKCEWNGKEYNNKAEWLRNDCRKRYKCKDGEVEDKEHRCPDDASCSNGACSCNKGFEVKGRNSNGFLKDCKATENANTCSQNNKQYKEGEYWLRNDCRKRYRCDKGQVKDKDHECPENSSCNNGECRCKNNFGVKSRDSKGFVKKCEESKDCQHDGKTYENGARWMDDKCERKMSCRNKNVQSRSHRCPRHSSCKFGGQCVCEYGYETKSVDGEGVLKKCQELDSLKCGRGFTRYGKYCLSINMNSRVSFWEAHDMCKKKGGRMLVVPDSQRLHKELQKSRQFKDGRFFIMGDTSLSAKSLDDFKNEASKKFVVNMMQRYQCSKEKQFNAFKRFAGKAGVNDWNYVSPVASRCLGVDENGPNLFKCTDKMGFICQEGGNEEEKDEFLTKWYSVNEPSDKGEKESLKDILKKYNNDYKEKADRLCTRPISMECREVGTNKLYSKENDQGLKMKYACERSKFECRNKDQSGGKSCPNMEIRFKCIKDDPNDCGLDMVKRNCENAGKVCVMRRTGAICVRQKKQRDRSDKISTSSCTMNGQKHLLYRCKATGDPHYETMDGFKFDFMGTCSYDFISTCKNFVPSETFPSFSIVSKNYKRDPRSTKSWTKGFSLTIGGSTYVFTQGKLHINDIEINAIGYEDAVIKILAKACGKSTTLIIETKFCLMVQWDNIHGLSVFVPEHFKNHVCGLCGDFDGDANNDLRLPGSNSKMSSTDINKEHMVAGFMDEESACPIKVVDPEPCSDADKIRLSQPKFCGIFDINGASPIVKAVRDNADETSLAANMANLREEFAECVNDVCWEPESDRCHDIDRVISGIHKALGIVDADLDTAWRTFADCADAAEIRCAERPNMEFARRFRSGCQNTCNDPELSLDCDDEAEESGCRCKEGFYLDAKMQCVSFEECDNSCDVELENGKRFSLNNGDEFVEIPCQKILMCKNGKLEEKKLTACSIHADCVSGGRKCQCHEGYIAEGDDCKADLSCRQPGYHAYGEKCYKFVEQKMDWHSAAITCGREGSVLARYDDLTGEELANFFTEIPKLYASARAHNRRVSCRKGSTCSLPRGYLGMGIQLKSEKDKGKCEGNFGLSEDKKSVTISGDCQAVFNVQAIKESRIKTKNSFRLWLAGNSLVVGQGQRGDKEPFQIDPPRMLDLKAFDNPNGCFQSNVNNDGKLIVFPNPRCDHRKPFICEYDNVGKIPHNPNDIKRIGEKGNFQESIEMCKLLNRPLVGLYNPEQNEKVLSYLRQLGGDGWIGGSFTNERFEWSDGNPFKYINWREREPNNHRTGVEQCVAMDKETGKWYTEDCSEPLFPICGPPLNMESASYSKYYKVKGFGSLPELRQKLAREGKPDYVCQEPIAVECSAQQDDGNWRNNFNQRGRAMECTPERLVCKDGEGMKCDTFRVRVMCPSDENQCQTLKKENINPCTGGQSCLPVRNHYICRCTGESDWDPKTQSCHKSCGHCLASGDPHYTTFAGKRYDFMGTCMYKFAGVCELDEFKNSPNFDIYTKNTLCGSRGASCIFYVEVHLRNIPYMHNGNERVGNFIFRIGRDRPNNYIFNDRELGIGELSVPGAFKVVRKSNYFNLISEALSLDVLFSGTKLSLNLPNQFIDKMCGLCGDCSSDKFRKRDGTLVSVEQVGQKLDRNAIIPVANEWIEPFDGSDPALCKVVKPIEECSEEMKAQVQGPQMCGVFKEPGSPISDCFEAIDPEPYYNDCVMDACHEDPMTSVCGTIRTYAQLCMRKKGIMMAWRSAQFCPMDCKDKMYRADASCEPMCGRGDSVSAICVEEPEEGCVCAAGFMRRGDECVTPDKCGCKVAIGESETVTIKPGESRLLPRCEEISRCEERENGASEEIRESVAMDQYAICIEDPMPRIDCVRGYVLQEDGRTCKRDPEACSEGFDEKSGMCVNVPLAKKVWRQAVHACNEKDGTLALINNVAKWAEIEKIMEEKEFEQIFISGQIVVKVGENDEVSYEPLLESTKKGKIEYYNFDYHSPPVVAIQLSNELDIEVLRGQETVLALIARRGPDGKAIIVAVPTDTQANFVCEERYVKPKEEEWYGPCNSDANMADNGDQETKYSLKKSNCLVCPHPMEIGCVKVPRATGTVIGDCQITRSGSYYSCSQGEDCLDHAVETKCARDVDECEEGLHDCPDRSSCKNTIGAYTCKCDADFPIMVKGHCKEKQTCSMSGPQRPDDFVYQMNGLSGVAGYVPYGCPFKVFETCEKKYDPALAMPLLSVYVLSQPKNGGMVQLFGGWIVDPVSRKAKFFTVYDSLLREGKFLYGDSMQTMYKTDLGFSCLSVRTSFIFVPPNTFVAQHFDKVFRFGISFPVTFGIEVSKEYASMACGMCSHEPTGEGQVIKLTPEQEQALSETLMKDPSGCSIVEEPEPTTTPPPTTTPAPPTTTIPPPTTTLPPPTTTLPPPTTPPTTPSLPDESGLFTTTEEPTTPPPTPPPTTPPPTTTPPPPPTTTTPPPPPTTTTPPPPPTTTPSLPDESGLFTTTEEPTTPPPTTTPPPPPPPPTTTTPPPPPTTPPPTTPPPPTTQPPPTTTTPAPPPTTIAPPTTPPTTPSLPDESGFFTTPEVPTTQQTTEPPLPPTTPPTTPEPTTPPATEPPTTIQPTPVIDHFCEDDVMAFCAALSDVCSQDYWKCREDLCYSEMDYCTYLEAFDVGECQFGEKMAGFVAEVSDQCRGYCEGEDMAFDYSGGEAPERCQDSIDDGESVPGMGVFGCRCEDGYKLSGKECVPQEECGCNYEDGIYLKKDDVFVNSNCTKKAICLGNGLIEENPMECSFHASCMVKEDGPLCLCDEGFFGNADKPNGCKEPDDEDESKVCYTRTDLYGIPTTTCNCKDGYVSNCTHCVDLDECEENRHDCDLSKEACENTPGSYRCTCANGFEAVNGECKDIDECKRGLARCKSHSDCVNTPGSYECECCAGFKYSGESNECERDPESGVDILVANPKCCIQCDYPDLCSVEPGKEQPYCFKGVGQNKEYPSYRAMFQYYCVNNLPMPRDKVQAGECPEVDPTSVPTDPNNPDGSDQTTSPGGAGTTIPGGDEGPGGVTSPQNGGTTSLSNAQTPPPPDSCNDPEFCQKIPPPPPVLSSGPVCGPSNQPNEKTFPSYCDMVKSVCRSQGGDPNNLPPSAIAAEPGECPPPTTTTPPPPPTTQQATPPPSDNPITLPYNTEPATGTAAPGETTALPTPVDPIPPSEPLFKDWTPWSRCRVDNPEQTCGTGVQSRTRGTEAYDDDREVLPVKPEDTYEERTCFEPCDPEDPDFDPEVCAPDAGICGVDDSKVCGSIGRGGPETYDNECELNVEACKAGKKPNVISKGECGEDQKPRQMCESGGKVLYVKYDEEHDGLTCVSEEKEIRKCSHLGCEGGFDNCCMATEYEKVSAKYQCFNDEGNEQYRGTKVFLSAVGCRCSNGEDDEPGTQSP